MKNDGGHAFPVSSEAAWIPGMSLRDWFAGMALQGLIASPEIHLGPPDRYAERAYIYADAMLKERET